MPTRQLSVVASGAVCCEGLLEQFMKPNEKKPETVFRVIDRETGEAQGSYSRSYCDEYDFKSVQEARTANVHGVFEDRDKYKIAKYRVTYELIEDDCEE